MKPIIVVLLFCLIHGLSGQTKVILDADTGNEVDDPYAIARALLEPSWDILALNAAHWQTSHWAIDQSMENSHRLNQMILGYLGMDIKTRRGGVARMFDWGDQAQHSAAAYEIIEQASSMPEGEKLNIVVLGALTNVASALYIEPEIEDKISVYWLGSTYDFNADVLRKNDFNCIMDIQALDLLLFSQVEMNIIPVNIAAKMSFTFEETAEELANTHPLCDFLVRRWDDHIDGGRQERTIWDLALISGMIHPQWVEKEVITTSKDNGSRQITYWKNIDATNMKKEFFETLKSSLKAP